MGIWYEGNLNLKENRREENGREYYIRGVSEADNKRYERYAVKTHFVEQGEDLITVLNHYVKPLYKEGDIVTLGEKVVSMCQRDTVRIEDVKLGFWAKFIASFAACTHSGVGISEPHKMQVAIDIKGLPLILLACVCAVWGKLIGRKGLFFEVAGKEVAGIDGFYQGSAFETYHNLAILSASDPVRVCYRVHQELGMSCVLVDANDINVNVLGRSPDLMGWPEEKLADLIMDNPAGQDDELTPFIIVRDIGEAEAQPYCPPAAISEPESAGHGHMREYLLDPVT
jgi:hypothetical protein